MPDGCRLFPAVLLGLLAAAPLASQRYNFRQYGQEEGLANLSVQCMLQVSVS